MEPFSSLLLIYPHSSYFTHVTYYILTCYMTYLFIVYIIFFLNCSSCVWCNWYFCQLSGCSMSSAFFLIYLIIFSFLFNFMIVIDYCWSLRARFYKASQFSSPDTTPEISKAIIAPYQPGCSTPLLYFLP